MAMDRKTMASMRAAMLEPKSAEKKKPADEEMSESYEITPKQLATLKADGEVTLEGGCTLKMVDANESEDDMETEAESE